MYSSTILIKCKSYILHMLCVKKIVYFPFVAPLFVLIYFAGIAFMLVADAVALGSALTAATMSKCKM